MSKDKGIHAVSLMSDEITCIGCGEIIIKEDTADLFFCKKCGDIYGIEKEKENKNETYKNN